jgi:hypothetical protein
MKNRLVICFMAFFASQLSYGGDGSHAGDNVRLLFQSARSEAASKVRAYLSSSGTSSNEVEKWVKANKEELAKDILETPEYNWVEEVLSHEAMTQNKRAAVITFSLPLCRLSYHTQEDAINLLIHESIHHLGITNEVLVNSIVIEIDKSSKQSFNFKYPVKMYRCEGKDILIERTGKKSQRMYRVSFVHGIGTGADRILGFVETKEEFESTYQMRDSFNVSQTITWNDDGKTRYGYTDVYSDDIHINHAIEARLVTSINYEDDYPRRGQHKQITIEKISYRGPNGWIKNMPCTQVR